MSDHRTIEQVAYREWWLAQTRKGDPARNPRLVDDAFKAGWEAALKHAEHMEYVRSMERFANGR